jgi:diacylglycerol kinase family enzyme
MKATVVLNASAASIAAEASATVSRVREAFARTSLETAIIAIGHEGIPAAARRAVASDADVVVLGGGDGTLSAGAAALLGSHKPLGILPLGSLNHFAKDVGIPLDLDQAVGTIERGYVAEVDVGEVNGHIFLNNSSIGLYPSAVAQREELRHRHGGGKWPAMISACVDVVRRFPLLDVTLQVDDRAVALRTPFVFVGNNRYEMSLFSLGTRTSLQGGELSVYLTQNAGRMGLVRLFFRALLGRLDQDRDFHSLTLPGVEIRTRRRSLRVSLDGEVVRMASPIRYIVRPRALRVLAPMPQAAPGEP